MVGVALSVLLSAGTKARGAIRKRVRRLIEYDGTRGLSRESRIGAELSPNRGKPPAFACRVSPRIEGCFHNGQGMRRDREDYGEKQATRN